MSAVLNLILSDEINQKLEKLVSINSMTWGLLLNIQQNRDFLFDFINFTWAGSAL